MNLVRYIRAQLMGIFAMSWVQVVLLVVLATTLVSMKSDGFDDVERIMLQLKAMKESVDFALTP